jgi:hypothetical protein
VRRRHFERGVDGSAACAARDRRGERDDRRRRASGVAARAALIASLPTQPAFASSQSTAACASARTPSGRPASSMKKSGEWFGAAVFVSCGRRDADEEEESGNDMLVEGEVLRARDLGHRDDAVRAGDALERRQHRRGELGVVDRDRVVLDDADVAAGARGERDVLGGLLDAAVDVVAHRLVEAADRAAQLDRVGDDVLAHAALDRADGDDRGLVRQVDLAADDRLQARARPAPR